MTLCPSESMPEYRPKRRELNLEEQKVFWRIFRKAQNVSWFFRFVNQDECTVLLWLYIEAAFIICGLCHGWQDTPYRWELFLGTVVMFHIYFVFRHMLAHAAFYCYHSFDPSKYSSEVCPDTADLPDPWAGTWAGTYIEWARGTFVFFVAFMHHHEFAQQATVREIVVSHWYSFSILPDYMSFFLVCAAAVRTPPYYFIVFATWELCTL